MESIKWDKVIEFVKLKGVRIQNKELLFDKDSDDIIIKISKAYVLDGHLDPNQAHDIFIIPSEEIKKGLRNTEEEKKVSEKQVEFWNGLRDYATKNDPTIDLNQRPMARSYYEIPTGRSFMTIRLVFDRKSGSKKCELRFDDRVRGFKEYIKKMEDQKVDWINELKNNTISFAVIGNICDNIRTRVYWEIEENFVHIGVAMPGTMNDSDNETQYKWFLNASKVIKNLVQRVINEVSVLENVKR